MRCWPGWAAPFPGTEAGKPWNKLNNQSRSYFQHPRGQRQPADHVQIQDQHCGRIVPARAFSVLRSTYQNPEGTAHRSVPRANPQHQCLEFLHKVRRSAAQRTLLGGGRNLLPLHLSEVEERFSHAIQGRSLVIASLSNFSLEIGLCCAAPIERSVRKKQLTSYHL